MIEARGLTKTWVDGSSALDDVDLAVEEGDIYALVGRSGAGKSTLLRCINGLTSYQAGSLKVDGREIRDMSEGELREFRRHIGMIFQHFSLLERETVYNNIALPMRCWRYTKTEIDRKVRTLLDFVGLADKANVKPRSLSGGQKQRVAIARSLTMDSKILLCDEATSALDPHTEASILDLLAEVNRDIGITVIVVTHQMEVVRKACGKASILEGGRIADAGSVENIFFQRPPSLQRLLGEGGGSALPKTGHNVQVFYPIDTLEDGAVLARMAKDLDYPFAIVEGSVRQYQDSSRGLFTINVDDAHLEQVGRYLDAAGVAWRSASVASVDLDEGEV